MSDIFKAIGRFFKKLFSALKKVLAVVLVILAVIVIVWACIFCPPLGGVLFGVAFASSSAALAFGCCLLVGAFLVDRDTASKVVGKVGEAAGDAASSVGQATGNVVSGVLSGLTSSNLMMWVALGVGAYFLLSSSGPEDKRETDTDTHRKIPERNRGRSDHNGVVVDTHRKIPDKGRGRSDRNGVVVATPAQLEEGILYG